MYPELAIFDVDGTILDHENAARLALEAVREKVPEISAISYRDLDMRWGNGFPRLWKAVLEGRLTIEDTRIQRFQWILEELGSGSDPSTAKEAALVYGEVYDGSISAITGAEAVMKEIRSRGIQIALLTNNTPGNQEAKLERAGLRGLYNYMLASGEAGISKPDARIFRSVLDKFNCDPKKAVMVGNSFTDDVTGAYNAGIRPVWFNRFREKPPECTFDFVEITGYLPVNLTMEALFSGF